MPKTRLYHSLSEEALIRLQGQGDLLARGVLEDRRIVRSMAIHTWPALRTLGYSGEHLVRLTHGGWVLFRKNHGGHVEMHLRITEKTSIERIKGAWEEIVTWRKLLREWNGPTVSKDRFLRSLEGMHQRGASCEVLAQKLANMALEWLERYSRALPEEFKEAASRVENWSESEQQRFLDEHIAALQYFRMVATCNEEALMTWWKEAIRHVASNGKDPITADVPISAEQIREALRYFRKCYPAQK